MNIFLLVVEDSTRKQTQKSCESFICFWVRIKAGKLRGLILADLLIIKNHYFTFYTANLAVTGHFSRIMWERKLGKFTNASTSQSKYNDYLLKFETKLYSVFIW